MSPPSTYGSINTSNDPPPSAAADLNSIGRDDGSSTSTTSLRQFSRFSSTVTSYSAKHSIVFLLVLLMTIAIIAGRFQQEWYNSLSLLRSSSKNTKGSIIVNSEKKYKTLYLLRHAKSSWVNSSNINDYDRQLSPSGRKVAHTVGKSLYKRDDVDLPDLILASPSMRTRETLDLVMAAWTKRTFDESNIILYSESWYDLSDEGYFNYLVHVLSEEEDASDGSSSNDAPNYVDTVMIVGHNPAIEKLLNKLLFFSPNDQVQHYSPGHFYAVSFPTLERWSDLGEYIGEKGRRGVVELHLPE